MSDVIKYNFADEELIIKREGDFYRLKYVGNKPMDVIIASRDKSPKVIPVPPTETDVKASCVYVRFKNPVVVPGLREIELSLKIPADIGVVLEEGGEEKAVLVIPFKMKFALYGPHDIGYLCRYIGPEEAEALGAEFTYEARLSIYNKRSEPSTVSFVVLPLDFFKESHYEAQMIVEDRQTAYVFYGERVKEPSVLSPFFFIGKQKFVMGFGY